MTPVRGYVLSQLNLCIQRFAMDETAVTSIEYGLIAALGAMAAIPAMAQLGGKLSSTFSAVAAAFDDGDGMPPPMAPAMQPAPPPPPGP